MSDFDFDALRDPAAPDPGGRQRAAVDARARELRGHARRVRLLASAAVIVAIAAIAGGVVAATRSTESSITVAGNGTTTVPTTTPVAATNSARFVPPTHLENGLVAMPVTLPDGEHFTVRYPPSMHIAQLGFAGTTSVNGMRVSLVYSTIQQMYAGAPIGTVPGAEGGSVPLFRSTQRRGYTGSDGDELAFQFGPWLAIVDSPSVAPNSQNPIPAEIRSRLASSLSGILDADGYLVLHTSSGFAVGDGFEGGFGRVPGDSLELDANLSCGQPESDTSARRRATNGDGSEFVSWCDGQLHVSAEGSSTFIDQAQHDLQISPVTTSSGSSTTTTTTTTTPVSPPSPAVSASFVSSDQGFVLEQDGRVDVTGDGGATWAVAGSLPTTSWQSGRIRFIGASDGFAFVPGNGPLMITHDAGATWTTVDTPFTDTFDLAISDGEIYAVGLPAHNTGSLGVWSTPVEHLVWKRDPLPIPIGAGPVPAPQIVLAGASGWIVENDRTVIAGARLRADGSWASWNPPCLGKGGSAYLSASTASDLFATCDEGAWTGGSPTPTVYVSHDSGDTFARHLAPAFDPMTSPTPTVAVITDPDSLWRTTDDGASWHVVAHIATNAGPVAVDTADIGFTTTTQGFSIGNYGPMLMTHDSGATWKAISLP